MNTKPRAVLLAAMLMAFALAAWWMVGGLVQGQALTPLLAAGLVALALLFPSPIRGLYGAYFLLWLVPFGLLRLDFPLFRTPLNLVALVTIGLAVARMVVSRRKIPSSPLYLPLALLLFVLALYTVTGHGTATGGYLQIVVKGLWPFAAIVLLVGSPRQARNVLLAAAVALLLQALLLLPSQIAQAIAILQGKLQSVWGTWGILRAAGSETSVLPSILGGFGWQTMQAFALASPVFLALFLAVPKEAKRLRRLGLFGFIILAASVVLGGYLQAFLTLFLGAVAVLWTTGSATHAKRTQWLARAVAVAAVLLLLVMYMPGGDVALGRVTGFRQDASIGARMWVLPNVWAAFLESPLFGWGWHINRFFTANGFLDGHGGVVNLFASFGLMFIVPLGLLLWRMGGLFGHVARQQLSSVEAALIAGFKASLVIYLATLVTGGLSLGDISQDFIMWTMAGLATVWRHWHRSGLHERLVA